MAEEFLSMFSHYRDKGWNATRLGDFNCPCGRNIEQDGECPNGHTSPMRQEGMI